MRFLHTSDWHLGKPLRNRNRDPESETALAEVLDIARRESIDCLLVAGDVFDSVAPPPEAERQFFEFVRELVGARIPAVIIAGNHDHPRRLGAISRVLDLVDIQLRSESVRAADGGVVEVASRDTETVATIATLPWVPERKAREWGSLSTGQQFLDYADEVAKRIEELCESFRPSTVNLLLAHLYLSGAVVAPESGERALHIGDVYGVAPQRIPQSVQYAALGHVHNPEQPRAFSMANAYYSGSLLQVDFGEAGQQKRVNIVDVKPGAHAKIEHIPLTNIKQLKNIGSHKEGLTLDQIKAQAADAGDAYLKVFLKVDAPAPGLAEQVRELLPNTVDIVIQRSDAPQQHDHAYTGRLSPPELFTAYHQQAYGAEPRAELVALFNRLYEESPNEAA